MRNLEVQHLKNADEHYKNSMYLSKDERNEEELKRRHIKEQDLTNGLIKNKNAARTELTDNLKQLEVQYLGMTELQNSIREAKELREKIENAKIKIQFMEIQVKVLTEANEFLSNRREELQEEKAEADIKNEELRT